MEFYSKKEAGMVRGCVRLICALVMVCAVVPSYSMECEGVRSASGKRRAEQTRERLEKEKKDRFHERTAHVEAGAKKPLRTWERLKLLVHKTPRTRSALVAIAGTTLWIAYEGYKRKIRPCLQHQEEEHLLGEEELEGDAVV